MKQADRVAVTLAAQETLRLVAFRQIHKVCSIVSSSFILLG